MSDYPLESTERERDRLELQAKTLRPLTERLLRSAGAGPGASILDLGTGAGDVALLAAEVVGKRGRVVSVDRDAANLARARARAEAAGASQITFVEGDILSPPSGPFDVAIGRYVLMYAEDPAAVVRAVANVVRVGGCVAFHELNLYDGFRGDCWPAAPQVFDAFASLGAAMRKRVQTSIGVRLPAILIEAGLDVSDWNFELSAPLVRRDDAIIHMDGLARAFLPMAVADAVVRAEDVDLDAMQRAWRDAPWYAALMLAPSVLGWARRT